MSNDPLAGMDEIDVQQLAANRSRMFMYIALTDAIPLIGLTAALANFINYGVSIALFLVAAVVVWFIITSTINKVPASAPESVRRSLKMLRLSFTAALLLIPVVVWFIFNGTTN